MTRLLVATANPAKLDELAAALEQTEIEVVALDALDDQRAIAETGKTFEANARLKAEGYSKRTDLPVLADDSGLEVDALDGAPGVMSARYGSPTLTDKARCRAVLKALTDVPEPKRTARFRCVLAIAKGGRTLATFEGTAEGRLLTRPKGKSGFGYDPIFFHPGAGSTFAELNREEKQALSHRGAAIQGLLEALRRGELTLG
jgi:XTP/dITP diphosphohydrolase